MPRGAGATQGARDRSTRGAEETGGGAILLTELVPERHEGRGVLGRVLEQRSRGGRHRLKKTPEGGGASGAGVFALDTGVCMLEMRSLF